MLIIFSLCSFTAANLKQLYVTKVCTTVGANIHPSIVPFTLADRFLRRISRITCDSLSAGWNMTGPITVLRRGGGGGERRGLVDTEATRNLMGPF